MLTYEEARKLLGTRESKKLARNTWLREEKGNMVIRFWETDVIVIDPKNEYTLNSGGYKTFTTKDRLNTFSPANVGQDKGLWYVYNYMHDKPKVLFADGIRVDSSGKVLSGQGDDTMPKLMRKVDRMVSKYIAGYAAYVMKNGLEEDTRGDCFGCCMKDVTGEVTEGMGYDHYLSHFAEKYYVPSILLKAVEEMGYGNPGIVWGMMKHGIAQGREPYDLKRVLRRFFRTRKQGIVEELARRAN